MDLWHLKLNIFFFFLERKQKRNIIHGTKDTQIQKKFSLVLDNALLCMPLRKLTSYANHADLSLGTLHAGIPCALSFAWRASAPYGMRYARVSANQRGERQSKLQRQQRACVLRTLLGIRPQLAADITRTGRMYNLCLLTTSLIDYFKKKSKSNPFISRPSNQTKLVKQLIFTVSCYC